MGSAVLLPTLLVSTGTIFYLVARAFIASRRQARVQAHKEQEEARRSQMAEEDSRAAEGPVYRTGPPNDVRELNGDWYEERFGIQFGKMTPQSQRFRVRFGTRGAFLEGLPACGGFYTLSPTGVELDFLGIDRFHSVERPADARGGRGAAEEEAFCDGLRLLGAEWIPNEYSLITGPTGGEALRLDVGWEPLPGPGVAGVTAEDVGGCGVWVLKISELEAAQKGTGVIRYARSMEERCRILERLGAVFYKNPKECPDLNLP